MCCNCAFGGFACVLGGWAYPELGAERPVNRFDGACAAQRGSARMRSRRKVAALVSSVLVVACLSGCASVPRTETLQTTQIASGPLGPPVPARLNKTKNDRNVIAADVAPALRKTGDVLLDIVEAVLPEPGLPAYHGTGFRGWHSWARSTGWTGCNDLLASGSDVQWCSYP